MSHPTDVAEAARRLSSWARWRFWVHSGAFDHVESLTTATHSVSRTHLITGHSESESDRGRIPGAYQTVRSDSVLDVAPYLLGNITSPSDSPTYVVDGPRPRRPAPPASTRARPAAKRAVVGVRNGALPRSNVSTAVAQGAPTPGVTATRAMAAGPCYVKSAPAVGGFVVLQLRRRNGALHALFG